MKIRLTENLSIPSRHGLTPGLVVETIERPKGSVYPSASHWVVAPNTNKPIPIYDDEYELVFE